MAIIGSTVKQSPVSFCRWMSTCRHRGDTVRHSRSPPPWLVANGNYSFGVRYVHEVLVNCLGPNNMSGLIWFHTVWHSDAVSIPERNFSKCSIWKCLKMWQTTDLQQLSQCVLYLAVIRDAFPCQVLVLSECDIAAEISLTTVGRCKVPDKLNIFPTIYNNCCLFGHLLMYFSK